MAQYIKLLGSESRTANVTGKVQSNWQDNYALHLVVDVTAGSPNLVVSIKGFDDVSDKAYTILDSSIINGTGTTLMKVGPDYTAGANVAKEYLPAYWRVDVTQSGAVATTYSIGASVI